MSNQNQKRVISPFRNAGMVIVLLLVLLVLGILFYFLQPLSKESTEKTGNDSLESIEGDIQSLGQDLDSFDKGLESDFQEVDDLLGQLEG